MQSARALLLERPRASKARLRLAATIGILLDVLDALIAAHVELAELRGVRGDRDAARAHRRHLARRLARSAASQPRIAVERRPPACRPTISLAVDALKREAGKLEQNGQLSEVALAAMRATTQRIGDALGHIRRLERALSDDEVASAAIGDVDLAAFWSRPSFDLKLLAVHFTPEFAGAALCAAAVAGDDGRRARRRIRLAAKAMAIGFC